jgi:hypothetical protein
MKFPIPSRSGQPAGYTLITTLMLTAVATILLGATLGRTLSGSKLNDRNNAYNQANVAAESAVEKVLSRAMVDFATGGEGSLSNNSTYYRNSLLPNSTESSYWSNFQFSDGQSNVGQTYFARTTTNANPPYVTLLQQYPGLNAFASTYRILSNVRYTNSNYGFVAAAQEDVQMAEIPVFQFAIFYNTLMEYSDCAPFVIAGRVHCNTNIYLGTVSGSSLTFNYFVTASGVITNPPWAGFAQSSWTGGLTYSGTPAPGWGTGEPVLTLPVGTNNTPAAVREIINPPPAGESTTNPVSSQRFANKAWMVITITNPVTGTTTNAVTATNYSVAITIKNSIYDGSPSNIYLGTNINSGTNVNWANTGISNWLSTNLTFYDQREGRTNHVVQIDIGKLGTWIGGPNATNGCTNSLLTSKWNATTPFNGIIYVDDNRTTNANLMNCVRLTNGVAITNGLYNSGLTVATQNPLYIWGNYNCPNAAYLGTTNTTLSRPCSFVCDAITILSANWADNISALGYGSRNSPQNTTINAAIIAGNVLSTDSSSTGFSGGVMNLTRLLENWSGYTLTLNTSIINLYNSVQATQQFQMPGAYYNAPSRNFSFDLNFTTSTGLPPGTPLVNRMIKATWCNPPPNNVSYAPSPTLDFVPR